MVGFSELVQLAIQAQSSKHKAPTSLDSRSYVHNLDIRTVSAVASCSFSRKFDERPYGPGVARGAARLYQYFINLPSVRMEG